jgi:type IV secretion system protein TrbL
MPPVDAFSPVHQQFALAAGVWYAALFDYANNLFLMLATIEIGLGAIHWMVAQQSHDYIAMGLFRKILWIGFMYAVLLFAHDWIPAIINSFMQAGIDAADIEGINPGEVFLQGLGLAGSMLKSLVHASLLFQPATVLTGLFAAFLLFIAFCAISYQLALTLMEAYIVTGGGVFLLGFGAFHGTVNITEKYLSYVVGVGIKLFVLCLIIGAGKQLAPMWGAIAQDADLMSIVSTPLAIAGGAMLYGTAAWMLPSLAASLASGTVGFGLQETIGTTMMASRLAMQSVAAPMALGAGTAAAIGIARQGARNNGGGLGGAIRGLGTSVSAVSREARNAAVPTLGRAVQNLQQQRTNMGGGSGDQGDGGQGVGQGGSNP